MIVELSHFLGTTEEETESLYRWDIGVAMDGAASLRSQEGRRSRPAVVGQRWSRECNTFSSLGQHEDGGRSV